MVITKLEDVTKQGFCNNTLQKTPSSGKSLISTYSIFYGWEMKAGGVGVGAYSRLGAYKLFLPLGWALIRGGR